MTGILLQPDPRRKRLLIVTEPGAGNVSAEILGTGIRAEGPSGHLSLPFPDFVPWAPGRPHLYTLSCWIGEVPGQMAFGMREVSITEQRICINQRPYVLKGVRYASAGDRAAIQTLAAAGFTWLRYRAEAVSDESLRTASELGLMASIEFTAGCESRVADDTVRRCFNFASVIAWECANEDLAAHVRSIDPTRPVFAPSRVFRPYQNAPEPVAYISATVLTPITRETEALLGRTGHARSINFLSLRGLRPPARNEDLVGLSDPAALDAHVAGSIRACVDAARSNPRLAGYCFEDALDRGESPGRIAAFTEAQAPVRPVISMARSNLVPREEVDVTVTLLNEGRIEGRGELSLQVVGPTNQVLWKKKRGVKLPKHGKELWTGTVAASGSVGVHRFVVRVLDERGGIVAESSVSFHVSPAVERWHGPIDVLDPSGRWLEAIKRIAPQLEATAPIILIPRLASSIRAWPDNALGQMLGRVREGAVGIVFGPPDDWSDLGAMLSTPIDLAAGSLFESTIEGSVGVARLHPLFEGLPAGGPLARPYRGLLTSEVLRGESEEDISPAAEWNGDTRLAHRVMVRRLGSGRMIFISLRLLERLGNDPVVDRLFINLLRHAERRAIDTKEIAKIEPRAVEWLRRERPTLRVWRIIGPFANWDGAGHDTVYPSEAGYEADATYAGWYRAAAWETWYQRTDHSGEVALSRLLRPDMVHAEPYPGTFYAYTDLTSEERVETRLTLRHTGTAKIWMNTRPLELERRPGADTPGADVVLKQGRNALLVKLSVTDCLATFTLRLRDETGLRWL